MSKETNKAADAAKDTKPAAAAVETKPVHDPDAIAAIAAENAELKAKLASAEARATDATFSADDTQLVELKVAAGLSREQAIEVVKAQKAHDRALAKTKG